MTGKGRRTIMKGDAPSYSGPGQIEGYYNDADVPILRTVRKGKNKVTAVQSCPFPEDSRRSFLTIWISGCREGEAVMLNPFQWKWNNEAILGLKLPVLKKRVKVKDAMGNVIYKPVMQKIMQQDGTIRDQTIYRPMSKQKIEYRDHLIPVDIPLGQTFIDMIHNLQTEGIHYILFKRKRFTREIVKDKATSTRSVQSRITELHPDLFPHGIRALLTRYLRDRYGSEFDAPELKDLFKWSSGEMAVYYLSGQKLANKMGIRKLPS